MTNAALIKINPVRWWQFCDRARESIGQLTCVIAQGQDNRFD